MGVPYPPCVSGNAYADLAGVYEWLTPEPLLTPEGNVAAFAAWIDPLPAGSRVLDCAAGVGLLAVGLAQRGFAAEATDISPAMIERTRALADQHGVDVRASVCAWEDLSGEARFDAVFCVGNSLAHAPGRAARCAALARMVSVLRPGGLLVLTSRNWERERAPGSRLDLDDRLVVRGGRRALVVRGWTIAADWDEPHALEIAVALLGAGGRITTHAERLAFWPFSHEMLLHDLRAAGLEPADSTYADTVDRYLVIATNVSSAGSRPEASFPPPAGS